MQAQLPNIPLTIKCTIDGGSSAIVLGAIGGPNYQAIPNPIHSINQVGYWMVVLDRSNLKVLENFLYTDGANIPPQFKQYLNSTDYIFIINTQSANNSQLPVGTFYKWLMKEGAGPELKGLEQTHAALNCGGFYQFKYVMVDVFGPESGNSFEFASVENQTSYVTLELQPLTINGKTMYVPVSLT